MEFVAGQTFEEALRKLGEKSPVGSILRSADWSRVPVAIRERSFFSSTVEDVRFLQRGQNFMVDFLKATRLTNDKGETYLKAGGRAQFIDELQQFALREGMGALDPQLKGTLRDVASETRLGLIFDTNLKSIHDYGYWKQGMDPDVLDAFPAQRFIRVAAVLIPRPRHQANLNEVRRKDDLRFWLAMNDPAIGGFGVPWGPWGFNSGMDVEDVGRAESDASGLTKPAERMRPVEKDFNDHMAASTQGLDRRLVNLLKMAFGDKVKFTKDAVHWRSASFNERTDNGRLTDYSIERLPSATRITSAPEAPANIDQDVSRSRLSLGEAVRSRVGEQVEFNHVVAAHFDELTRRGNRFGRLEWALDAVRNPFEVWRDGNKTTYLKLLVEKDRTRGVIVVVRNGVVETYFDTTDLNYFDRIRRGEMRL